MVTISDKIKTDLSLVSEGFLGITFVADQV
jgi:hypothetical protein